MEWKVRSSPIDRPKLSDGKPDSEAITNISEAITELIVGKKVTSKTSRMRLPLCRDKVTAMQVTSLYPGSGSS